MSKTQYIDMTHTLRVMPSKEEQRRRNILLGVGAGLFLIGAFKAAQLSQQTDLVNAARQGNLSAVRASLGGLSSADAPGIDGQTPIQVAAAAGRGDIVRVLLSQKVDPNSALEAAAKSGQASILRLLVESGARVRGQKGGLILGLAAQSGSRDAVLYLLNQGADKDFVNVPDDGMTPLLYAARSSAAGVVSVLLGAHARIHARTESGRTPLILAAAWNEPAACKCLLQAGSDLNAHDSKGQTALMSAAVVGNAPTLQYLLQSGASVNLKDKTGKTALDHALETGNQKVINMLRHAGAR
jgi:ankyrin repeat protein